MRGLVSYRRGSPPYVSIVFVLVLCGLAWRWMGHQAHTASHLREASATAINSKRVAPSPASSSDGNNNSSSNNKSLLAPSSPRHRIETETVPIFVSDEHQHALPRWFEHAERVGVKHFVLVHVDAHSDLAIPESFGAHPKPPYDRENTRTSNDEFIEYALASRLVTRISWVLPDWGISNEGDIFNEWEDGQIPPERAMVHVGHMEKTPEEPCDCIERGRRLTRDTTRMTCEAREQDTIEPHECSLHFGAPIQVVPGSQVVKHGLRLRDCMSCTPEELARPLDVILDIDEDYFATEDPVGRLVAAGWTNKTLSGVDYALARFCANSEAEEAHLGAYLAGIVAALIRGGDPFAAAETVIPAATPEKSGSWICRPDVFNWPSSVREYVQYLQEALRAPREGSTPLDMLRGLLDAGFSVAPLSERDDGIPEFPRRMVTLTGIDQRRGRKNPLYVTNDMVFHYTPTAEVLEREMAQLEAALVASGVFPHVRIVTVCRSIRDGYLPRRLHPVVEERILAMLARHIPNSRVVVEGRPTYREV